MSRLAVVVTTAVLALLALGAAPAIADRLPALHLAGTINSPAWMCQGTGSFELILAGRLTDAKGCTFSSAPIVALDAEELPYVFVCAALRFDKALAGVEVGFFCGYTLARWIEDESGRPLSAALLHAIARRSTMADVRALPTARR